MRSGQHVQQDFRLLKRRYMLTRVHGWVPKGGGSFCWKEYNPPLKYLVAALSFSINGQHIPVTTVVFSQCRCTGQADHLPPSRHE